MLRLPSKLKMLIVEDDVMIGRMIKDFFNSMAYEFFLATDGKQGLDICLKEFPNVVITDLMMPGWDGYWLITELRKLPEFAVTPIVAVTGGTEDMKKRALEAGAHVVLSKPIDREKFTETVDMLLRSSPFVKR